MTLQAYSIDVLDAGRENGGVLKLSMPETMANKTNLTKLQQILEKYPGPCEVQVKLVSATPKHFMLQQRVNIGHDLFGELKALLGPDSVS